MLRRLFEDEDEDDPGPQNAQKLPPLAEIERFLPNGGMYVEAAEDGWSTTGFLLKD